MKYLLIIMLVSIGFVGCKNEEKHRPNVWQVNADSLVKVEEKIQAKLDTEKAVVVCNPNLKEWAVMVDSFYFYCFYTEHTMFFDVPILRYKHGNVYLTTSPNEFIFKDYKYAIGTRDKINNFAKQKHYDDSIANLQHHYQICKP